MVHVREQVEHEGNWLVHAICLHLGKDCSSCKVGGITFKVEAARLRWEGEDGGRGDDLLQGIESLLFGWAPGPLLGFVGECIEGASDIGEVADKLLIEVHKAKGGLDLLDLHWGWPLCDPTDLCWIHGSTVFQDDQSEVLNLLLLELTFLQLEK